MSGLFIYIDTPQVTSPHLGPQPGRADFLFLKKTAFTEANAFV